MAAKASAQEILNRIQTEHPELRRLDWSGVMGYDSEILAQILGDVIKVENKSSRPGKRPSLSREAAESEFLKISTEDYSELPFQRTFNLMCGQRSFRHVASKCDLSVAQVQRLKSGENFPTMKTMEKIAKGFRKDPAFFLEYRIESVFITLTSFLMASPETATNWYLKTRGK